MTYSPSYRTPKFDQHVLVYKAHLACLVMEVIKFDSQDSWKRLVKLVGNQQAKQWTMEAY